MAQQPARLSPSLRGLCVSRVFNMTVLFVIRAADFWDYQTDGDYVRTHVSG